MLWEGSVPVHTAGPTQPRPRPPSWLPAVGVSGLRVEHAQEGPWPGAEDWAREVSPCGPLGLLGCHCRAFRARRPCLWWLSCLAGHLFQHLVPEDLDAFLLDMLPFLKACWPGLGLFLGLATPLPLDPKAQGTGSPWGPQGVVLRVPDQTLCAARPRSRGPRPAPASSPTSPRPTCLRGELLSGGGWCSQL